MESKNINENVRESRREAQRRVWDFLEDNLLGKNNFSQTSAISINKNYIKKLQEDPNVDMFEVAKAFHIKIQQDMKSSPTNYQKDNGFYHKIGTKLFTDYMESKGNGLTPSTFFKKELKEAVEMTQQQGKQA